MLFHKHNKSPKRQVKNRLAENTVFLYFMTFSNYLLNLVTIPYLTRVLGPSVYGQIGLAMGYMVYVQIILDFGFILSATQIISDNREDRLLASKVITSVTIVKVILCFMVLSVFILLYKFAFFSEDVGKLIPIYLLGNLCAALLPDYFYRGIENMRVISIRTIVIRTIFTALIFLLVKSENDAIYVPVALLIGNAVALIATYYDLYKKYKIHLCIPSIPYSLNMVKISMPFFISRIASTFYQALDVIVLGKYYGSSPIVGYFSSSDKIIALAKTGSSPLADSLYPYMLKNKDFKLVKRLLLITMPVITAGVIFVGICAEPICVLLFGSAYRDAGKILRLLLPIAWVILPTYIIAFPVMSPLGLVKYTNYSNVIGMIFQILGLFTLYFIGKFNVYTICGLTSITEYIVFLYRLIVVILHISHMRTKKQ